MKISKLLIGAAALVGAVVIAHGAQAGTLVPSLARLSAENAQMPQKVTRSANAGRALTYANAFGPHVNGSGEVQVYIHYRPGQQPAPAALRMLGAKRIKAALGVVQAWVPISRLHQLAGLAGVTRVGLPAYAVVRGLGGLQAQPADTCAAVPTGLDINSQGIAAENIQALLDQGVTGSGVKVGIISDGVTCLASSQAAGYMPSNVWVDSSLPGSGDEGTAMLEEVHAAAPGAELGFCGPNTSVDFVTCYQDFATWGANVIADDLGFPDTFFHNYINKINFTNGIQTFTQSYPDISLVTAAGNDRQDYFQGIYAPSSATSPIGLTPTGYTPEAGGTTGRTYPSVMAIGGSPYEAVSYRLPSSYTTLFMLTWNDPLNGPYDDLDLYLVDSNGKILDASTFDQASDGSYAPHTGSWNPPAEIVQYTNPGSTTQNLKLVVMCFVCNQTSNLLVKLAGTMDGGGSFATVAHGGVYGQAAMAEVISAAAARVNNTSGTSVSLETFSQTGPYIGGDWKNGTTSVPKPDITGIDGVTVSGAGGFSTPFYGTSAASPNVASVLALLRSGFPTANNTAAQWKTLIMGNANISRFTSPVPSSSEAGAGLIDAKASSAAFDAPITATITGPAGDPLSVNPNTDVQFTATCSYSGSEALNYEWTFGGNSGIANQSKLTPDPVQYANGGVYTVQFTCSDTYQSKSSQKTVEVQAAAVATDLALSTDENVTVPGTMTGTGLGGEQVSYNITSLPSHGTVTQRSDGVFLYTPANDYTGTDSFQFQIDNGVQVSNTATVTITVKATSSGGGGSGGGGGALGFGTLAGLMALAGLLALRRRR